MVDVRPEAANAFAVSMSAQTGLPISIARTPEEAVRGADIVITVTTGSAVNVEHSWLKRGAFVARLGSYQEVALDLFAQADKLIVDRWRYVSTRIPEMIALIDAGRLRREDVPSSGPTSPGGGPPGAKSADEIILYVALASGANTPRSCPKCTGRRWRAGWGSASALIASSLRYTHCIDPASEGASFSCTKDVFQGPPACCAIRSAWRGWRSRG